MALSEKSARNLETGYHSHHNEKVTSVSGNVTAAKSHHVLESSKLPSGLGTKNAMLKKPDTAVAGRKSIVNKAVTDLVLSVLRLLRGDLQAVVGSLELVELWDEG